MGQLKATPILVVDDDVDFLAVVRAILKPLEAPVVTATTAEQAVALGSTRRFAVVLLDIQLGDAAEMGGGLEVGRSLRELGPCEHTPFIFISGHRGREIVQQGYDLGAVDYLFKPVQQDLLLSKVRSLADLSNRMEQLRLSELRLRRAQKLESLGSLAAGLAHQINSPLQGMLGGVELLGHSTQIFGNCLEHLRTLVAAAREGPVSDALLSDVEGFLGTSGAETLEDMERTSEGLSEGTHRMGEIVRSMQDFANAATDVRRADINILVEETAAVVRNSARESTDIQLNLQGVPLISVVPADIRLALLQVMTNAVQAVEQLKGERAGTVEVVTRVIGEDVAVEVIDNGPGIPLEHHDRVFDPFFTTREVGKGVGMGLATAWGIVVREHNGTFTFRSSSDGTTFQLRLPLTSSPCKS